MRGRVTVVWALSAVVSLASASAASAASHPQERHGFWIGLGLYVQLVGAKLLARPITVPLFNHDVAWILLAFAIFNTYMMLWALAVNWAVFAVFLTLELTEIILFAANFATSSGWIKVGGYVGVLTALVAWYASAAGVFNGMRGRAVLPVGKPYIT